MIQVSNEFKKAIKSPERKIKGYVEVLYNLPDVAVMPNTNITSTYTSISNITTGSRVKQNYGTLDYLPLDGTYLTMADELNEDAGFISEYTVDSYLQTPRDSIDITLNFESTTINGFTLYLKNNGVKSFYYELSDGTQLDITCEEAQSQVQVIFDDPKTLTSISLYFTEFDDEYKKVRIEKIDLGITNLYKDQDLIEFTVDEEVNKLVEEVPINETNITLNNMSDLFNPLNPSGIVPYLSKNTLIKPYIGVLTENLGVEYVKMGEFYFDSYTNNSDSTTTLVGKNVLKQLEAKEITQGLSQTNYNYFLDRSGSDYNNTFKGLIENSGCPINIQINNIRVAYLIHLQKNDMLDFMKQWVLYQNGIFLISRNNDVVIKNINFNVVDSLTKNDLLDDASYKKIDKINTIKLIRETKEINDVYGGNETTYKMFDNYQIILNETTSLLVIEKPTSHLMSNFTTTFSNAISGQILWDNRNFLIARITGEIGQTVSITSSWTSYYSSRNSKQVTTTEAIYKIDSEKETMLEINDEIGFGNNISNFSNILNYTPNYEMRFDYIGDPSLEAGDYINVETPYGYKKLFIQKNRFKFDGGLEGSIEGVE